MLQRVAFAFVLLLLLCGATPPSARTPAVSIMALYRERMMLPPGAELLVKLVDTSTRRVLASAMLDNPHVPVHMDLAYEPSNVDATHTYAVAARILVNGEPFFATETPIKVITQGNSQHADILLVRVTATSPMMIEDRKWTLVELHGKAVDLEERPDLELNDGRASGFGGCNRFAGGYKLDGDRLTFSAAASTMMACIKPNTMETEGLFLKTFSSVRYWKVTESKLELLDAERKPLMRFESR